MFKKHRYLCRSETHRKKNWHRTMLEGRMRRVEGAILKFMALFESICIRKRLRWVGKGVLALSVLLVLHAACSLHWDWRDKRITGSRLSWIEEACGVQVTPAAFPLITNPSYPSDATQCPGEAQSLTGSQLTANEIHSRLEISGIKTA